jgi:hypothetical protein
MPNIQLVTGVHGELIFEEPQVARYLAVAGTGGGFAVPDPTSGSSDRHFQQIHAPGVVSDSLPVIFYRTRYTGKPIFSVRLNSTHLTRYTFTGEDPPTASWHEIIPANTLHGQG